MVIFLLSQAEPDFISRLCCNDIDFKENNEKNPIRKELEQLAKELGDKAPGALHEKLSHIDPEAARQIHANNIKRVIRAIEYFEQTGEKISRT